MTKLFSFLDKIPFKSLLYASLLILLTTKVFAFKVELGDWGKIAVKAGMSALHFSSNQKGSTYARLPD